MENGEFTVDLPNFLKKYGGSFQVAMLVITRGYALQIMKHSHPQMEK